MLPSILLILIVSLSSSVVNAVQKGTIYNVRIHVDFLCNIVADVPIQWTNCSTWTDQLSVEKVEANLWPPKRNQLLTVSVLGTAKETFVYGDYKKTLAYQGYALPSITGPLTDLGVTLPVHRGPVAMILFNTTIPEVAPDGQYDIYLSIDISWIGVLFCCFRTSKLIRNKDKSTHTARNEESSFDH